MFCLGNGCVNLAKKLIRNKKIVLNVMFKKMDFGQSNFGSAKQQSSAINKIKNKEPNAASVTLLEGIQVKLQSQNTIGNVLNINNTL